MTRWVHDTSIEKRSRDVVFTSPDVAEAIVKRYAPSGLVLDPCRGDGAFYRHMPNGSEWCEIDDGRDFFSYRRQVDWIVGNPPYSILNRWLDHSFCLANDIVYLLPVAKVFGSLARLRAIRRYGGIVEVWAPWTGRDIGFEFGWAVGAVHFRRGYSGATRLDVPLTRWAARAAIAGGYDRG